MATFRINAVSKDKEGNPVHAKDDKGRIRSVKFLGNLVNADSHIIPPFAPTVENKAFVLWLDTQDFMLDATGEQVEINPAKMAMDLIANKGEKRLHLDFTISSIKQEKPSPDGKSQSLTVNLDRSKARSFKLVDAPKNVGWTVSTGASDDFF